MLFDFYAVYFIVVFSFVNLWPINSMDFPWSVLYSMRGLGFLPAGVYELILHEEDYCLHVNYSYTEFNTLRPSQNGRHFADAIFKCIYLNENVWIPLKISLKFVPKNTIENFPALVQIMAWRRPGDKLFSEPVVVSLPRIYVSLGLNEFTH